MIIVFEKRRTKFFAFAQKFFTTAFGEGQKKENYNQTQT